jgi:predicted Zn-dependent peptidase
MQKRPVMEEIIKLQQEGISELELQKVKNKTESMMAFEDMSVMNRATSLAMYELLGDADLSIKNWKGTRGLPGKN